MENEIKEIMSRVFELQVNELPSEFRQNEIANWDSLRHLSLIIELESSFSVSYEPEEIGEMNSFQKVVAFTKEKISANA